MHIKTYLPGFLLTTLLSGCISIVPVKEMAENKDVYLTSNFSIDSLSKDVQNHLAKDGSPSRFKKIHLKINTSHMKADGKTESPKQNITLIDQGNGLIQEISESSNNDITYYLSYRSTYRNFWILKSHGTNLSRTNAPFPIEVKQIKNAGIMSTIPKQGDVFPFEFSTGIQPQLANFTELKFICTAGGNFPANQFHPALDGMATDLKCELFNNNVVDTKSEYVFLHQYRIALLKSVIDSSLTSTYKLTDFKVER